MVIPPSFFEMNQAGQFGGLLVWIYQTATAFVKNLCAVRNMCIIDPNIWEEKDISSALDRFETLFTDINKAL